MSRATPVDRDWIVAELVKGIAAERTLAADAKARAGAPQEPSLSVLYNEIATADERHAAMAEVIATRYGYTPARSSWEALGRAWGNLKGSVGETGSTPLERLGWDLAAKAVSVHWLTTWVRAFTGIGDAESARELAAVLTEEQAHRDALQEVLCRMVEGRARGETKPPA